MSGMHESLQAVYRLLHGGLLTPVEYVHANNTARSEALVSYHRQVGQQQHRQVSFLFSSSVKACWAYPLALFTACACCRW